MGRFETPSPAESSTSAGINADFAEPMYSRLENYVLQVRFIAGSRSTGRR